MGEQAMRTADGHAFSSAVVQRASEALKLRLQGKTFGQIADELGYGSKGAAYEAYRTALDWSHVQLDLQELVQEESLKLDSYAMKLLTKANGVVDPRTIEVLVKVAERKAKLLGLDAPEKKQITAAVGITELRVQEVDPEFVANVLRGLNTISRPALVADNEVAVDTSQADGETGRVSGGGAA